MDNGDDRNNGKNNKNSDYRISLKNWNEVSMLRPPGFELNPEQQLELANDLYVPYSAA